MKKSNLTAIMWFILSLCISVCNDAVAKMLVINLEPESIAFLRAAISTLVFIPIVIKEGITSIVTQKLNTHILRGLILAVAMSLWNYGIASVPIATVTLMSFTIPIFTVLMAVMFLKEKITCGVVFATILGLTGSLISAFSLNNEFSITSLMFLIASLLFATLDTINKGLLNMNEKTIPMVFYSNLFSTLFLLFIPKSTYNLYGIISQYYVQIILLGLGANLILYCIIKAFTYANASFLAPIRYMELVISLTVGYIFFNEGISMNMLIGSVLIVLSLTIIDLRKNKKIPHAEIPK